MLRVLNICKSAAAVAGPQILRGPLAAGAFCPCRVWRGRAACSELPAGCPRASADGAAAGRAGVPRALARSLRPRSAARSARGYLSLRRRELFLCDPAPQQEVALVFDAADGRIRCSGNAIGVQVDCNVRQLRCKERPFPGPSQMVRCKERPPWPLTKWSDVRNALAWPLTKWFVVRNAYPGPSRNGPT